MKNSIKKTSHEGTVGVRFEKTPGTVYSYRVKDVRKVHLGQELVVVNEYGTTVVFVVRIGGEEYFPVEKTKFITRKVVDL